MSDLSTRRLERLVPELLARAQAIYDAWDQDPRTGFDAEHGYGGICDDIAAAFADVLVHHGIECVLRHFPAESHIGLLARLPDGIYILDILPSVYEENLGELHWVKRQSVTFVPHHLTIGRFTTDLTTWPPL